MKYIFIGLIISLQGVSIYIALANNSRLKQITEMACFIGNKTEAFGCINEPIEVKNE